MSVDDLRLETPFASGLARHGDAVALVDGDRRLSYAELAAEVDACAEQLGPSRRLVLVEGTNRTSAVVGYLGALAAGHPVALVDGGPSSRLARAVLDVYDPDVVVAGVDGAVQPAVAERRAGTAHELHPELALLLSTSGSTGSPKLVRLSHENLRSNAEAIATYLGLAAHDVAQTTLPLHYCYGLSVLHSHLTVGAAVVLQGASVLDPCFWRSARTNRVTNLAGVPHTFELLDRAGFDQLDLPDLRFVTQAGGRMAPEMVRRYAALGAARGWRLFVMYGQTEATARMAYLPPEEAALRPTSIGRAVPGGALRVDAPEGEVGELVYAGPNVMLGYATGPADLAAGATLRELRTGDLARRDADGFFHVVGRASRFVKPFGLRVDLDRLEHALAEAGINAACAGDDARVAVAVTEPRLVDPARAEVRRLTGLPPAALAVVPVDTVPRVASGKVDHAAVLALAALAQDGVAAGSRLEQVRRLYAAMLDLPLEQVASDATFVDLGGDSLTYVEVSVRLEQLVGPVPPGWHTTPIEQLVAPSAPPRGRTRVETTLALRVLGILAVVLGHAGDVDVGGGAHVLLVVTGYNLGRFQLAALRAGAPLRRLLASAARLAAPSAAWIALVVLLTDQLRPASIALVTPILGAPGGRGLWRYWYVEVVVALLVGLGAALAWRPARRLLARRPDVFSWSLLGAGLLLRSDLLGGLDGRYPRFQPHDVLWLVALGVVAERARTTPARLAVSATAAAALAGYFPSQQRALTVLAGVLVLVWVPALPVPRRLHRPLGAVAGASLFVYLTHWQVLGALPAGLPVIVAVAAALVAGVAAERTWGALVGLVRRDP